MNKNLNIISFDVPFPPNYGGAIDVFYKIKALHKLGVKIHLHTYEYGRGQQQELEKYCKTIFYYKRNIKLKNVFSKLPFIVKTRTNKNLTTNLLSNNFPIFFEGIHTTFPLLKNNFNNRVIIVRAHNIEHNYYKGLSKSESNKIKKLFYHSESIKLHNYQGILNKANYILAISPHEQEYFSSKFSSKSVYIPAFQENISVNFSNNDNQFALYHGDLRVSDNIRACLYLIKIFSKIDYPLVIASDYSTPKLKTEIKKHDNIRLVQLKSNEELKNLIQQAHINILPTFQNTGIKLKLLNALFNGRFCLVNDAMVKDTGLENICEIANSKKEFILKISKLSKQKFTKDQALKREHILKIFNTSNNAQKILNLLN